MKLPKYMEKQLHMDSNTCELYLVSNIYNAIGLDVWYETLTINKKCDFLFNIVQAMYGYLCGSNINEKFFDDILKKVEFLIENIKPDDFYNSGEDYEKYINIYKEYCGQISKYYENVKEYKIPGKKIPHIIILLGNSGNGKSYVSRMLTEENTNTKMIVKYSTRKIRGEEKNGTLETIPECSLDFIENLDYKSVLNRRNEYTEFGFERKDIEKALKEGKNPVISTQSLSIYDQIVRDFPCQTHIIYVTNIILNDNHQKKIFEERGSSVEEINNRLGVKQITDDDIYNHAFNLRTLVNPIEVLKSKTEEERRNFILNQLKYIFYMFGAELDIELEESKLLDEYDELYFTTMFRNDGQVLPFIPRIKTESNKNTDDKGTPKV